MRNTPCDSRGGWCIQPRLRRAAWSAQMSSRTRCLALVTSGRIGEELPTHSKEEAKRRAAAGTFFGHIAYASLSTKKSG